MSILLSSSASFQTLHCSSSPSRFPPLRPKIKHLAINTSFLNPTPLPTLKLALRPIQRRGREKKKMGAVCYAAAFNPLTLQWVSAISTAILMLVKGTAIHKSFLVPLFALQAPSGVISWIKGEYGTWIAFVALLVRLFYFIPGELDLPFLTMLLVIVAPYQTMDLRGSQAGAIISFVIAGYLAFQHFSRAGSLGRAFDQGAIIATIAIICVTVVSCLFLF